MTNKSYLWTVRDSRFMIKIIEIIKRPIDRMIHKDYYGQNRIKLPFLDQNLWSIG